MKRKKVIITLSIGMSLMLGGCINLDITSSKGQKVNSIEAKQNHDYYVPVQDYTGEGYALPNGERTDKIAKAHRSEIEVAVKKYFKEKYKTDIVVHNIVGAKDGASVFVESVGRPHFNTFAIVPIDVQNKKVLLNEVWSQEGEIEEAIKGGIYAMVFEEKIKKLNDYFNDLVTKYPVVGIRKEAINNVDTTGYSTPFYYVTFINKQCDDLYNVYITNPKTNKVEFMDLLNKSKVDPNNILVTIDIYMREKNVNPDNKILDKIASDLENMDDLPPGSYSIFLNDNNVNKRTGVGTKDNTISKEDPDSIVKQY